MKMHTIVSALTMAAIGFALQAGVLVGPFQPGTGSWSLVSNGDFEAGVLADWYDQDLSKGSFVASTETRARGGFSAKGTPVIDNPPEDNFGFALDSTPGVNLTAGVTYVLSGFIKAPTAHPTAPDPDAVYFYLDLNDVPFDVHPTAAGGIAEWQFVWEEFTAPYSGAVTPRAVIDQHFKPTDIGYFDEIALTPRDQFVPPVPVPELATWPKSVCLGLLAFATLRRFVRGRCC